MAQYDKIMENAHAIAERERQRQHQESDPTESDNQLLVPPSSLFNGMDGIESSQSISVELADVEMGGTSSNSQSDCIGGASGQVGSGQVGGGQVGGGPSAQAAKTSPRRTRSGKVVRYTDKRAFELKCTNLQ